MRPVVDEASIASYRSVDLTWCQVDEFVRITDNTYTRSELLQMEEHVLEILDFELTQPTSKTFVRRFVQVSDATLCPKASLLCICNACCGLLAFAGAKRQPCAACHKSRS